jgi:hypothetical protein
MTLRRLQPSSTTTSATMPVFLVVAAIVVIIITTTPQNTRQQESMFCPVDGGFIEMTEENQFILLLFNYSLKWDAAICGSAACGSDEPLKLITDRTNFNKFGVIIANF